MIRDSGKRQPHPKPLTNTERGFNMPFSTPPRQVELFITHKSKDGLNRPCRRKQKQEESQTPPYTSPVNPP